MCTDRRWCVTVEDCVTNTVLLNWTIGNFKRLFKRDEFSFLISTIRHYQESKRLSDRNFQFSFLKEMSKICWVRKSEIEDLAAQSGFSLLSLRFPARSLPFTSTMSKIFWIFILLRFPLVEIGLSHVSTILLTFPLFFFVLISFSFIPPEIYQMNLLDVCMFQLDVKEERDRDRWR